MSGWGRLPLVALALLPALPGAAGAQHLRAGMAGSVLVTRLAREEGDVPSRWRGVGLGAAGALEFGPVQLQVHYREGTLDGASGEDRELVEGAVLIGVRFFDRLTVLSGGRIRAQVTPLGRERWAFWEARVRGDATLVSPWLSTYVELSRSLAGDTNLGDPFGFSASFAAGVMARLPRLPLWLSVGYALDRVGLGREPGHDTVEHIVAQAGFGLRGAQVR